MERQLAEQVKSVEQLQASVAELSAKVRITFVAPLVSGRLYSYCIRIEAHKNQFCLSQSDQQFCILVVYDDEVRFIKLRVQYLE